MEEILYHFSELPLIRWKQKRAEGIVRNRWKENEVGESIIEMFYEIPSLCFLNGV